MKQIQKKLGICTYSENHTLIFTPDLCVPGDVDCTTAKGKLNMLADGTFQFDELPKRIRYRTKLIKKLASLILLAISDNPLFCAVLKKSGNLHELINLLDICID